MNLFFIFPTQLFNNTTKLKNEKVYLIEEPYYFTRLKFHKLKIAYHRATMKNYYEKLKKKGFDIKYIDFPNVKDFYKQHKTDNIKMYHPVDIPLLETLKKKFKNLKVLETLNFTFSHLETKKIKENCYKNGKYSHSQFYKYQRKELDILMKDNKPINNTWSYDKLNRDSFPDNTNFKIPKIIKNKYTSEAIKYTNNHFKNNYGSLENFIYPITSEQSKKWLKKFLEIKLKYFGPYQDAIGKDIVFGFHSILSPMMNIGLITDKEVITISNDYYSKNKKDIPIQSYEGFIRQVIGWRNYMYLIYLEDGEKLRKCNFFKHKNKLNDKFWTGKTNIDIIDDGIKKIVEYSYAHHIERLMVLGNFMLLCKTDPNEVYRIFSEWTIDAYDWVMVPNVYGMSQYADKGIVATRPYISSSNYLFKMSNYKKTKNSEWNKIFDSLYYSFINDNKTYFKSNYALSTSVSHWNKKSSKEKENIIKTAKKYINSLSKK